MLIADRAGEQFAGREQELKAELGDIESSVTFQRRFYDDVVEEYDLWLDREKYFNLEPTLDVKLSKLFDIIQKNLNKWISRYYEFDDIKQ